MILFAQKNTCFASCINESFPCFGSFLRSHSAFLGFENGADSVGTAHGSLWDAGLQVFPGFDDMADAERVAFAPNEDRALEPTQVFRHNAPQRLLRAGV
jgi:hypothetical protein